MYTMEHTREAYGKKLVALGRKYENIVVLDADLSCSTKTALFGKEFPERFINIGISEADMIGTAAGLAASGKTVFASTFAMFGCGRTYEQIRNTVAYGEFNVKIVVTHSGLAVGEDGASHQAIEDIALMRVIPNMIVLVPADARQTETALEAAVEYSGPMCIRLCRPKTPVITNGELEIGKAYIMRQGTDITLAATGSMVAAAMESAEILQGKGVAAEVINVSSIKPLDIETIRGSAAKTGKMVTVEDHSVIGGLGSAIAEQLIQIHPVPMRFVGVQDTFGESGQPVELYEKYGLTPENIVKTAGTLLS